MRVLALDISSKTGYALFEKDELKSFDTLFVDQKVKDFGPYPQNYIKFAEFITDGIYKKTVIPFDPEVVVIEETNASRQNYSQKTLEYIHFALNKKLGSEGRKVAYIRDGQWKRLVGAIQNTEERRLNQRIARLKKKTGKRLAKIDGKVIGKRTRKHYALRAFKEIFGIELQRKFEDAADAALLGYAYLKGAPLCDGTAKGGVGKRSQDGQHIYQDGRLFQRGTRQKN